MSLINTVKITNTDLIRDMDTQAVLNTDREGLARYKETRRKTLMARRESEETKKRLEIIEREMTDLKNLMSELTALRSRG